MNFAGHCQQALVNLTAAKLRSFLAVLGILVGTAAVVALISSGQLATEKALAQFKALGTDLLAVCGFLKKTDKYRSKGTIFSAQKGKISDRIPPIIYIWPPNITDQHS